jgi:type II secretory ATPase GspE/PulE/Tfp pilus assembly ATPase PilB-like protein
MILSLEQDSAVLEQAKKEGFRTMRDWGEQFAAEKKTTLQEVLRVTT